ncbi:MAG: hypothetical protein A2838_00870 [Candidatus Zambryskibacteria bacterium RIFCSPHIGHO2_01_FULL_46_25]|uniref:UDP-N-acetylglucosamine kinase n=2 Tax=Parcubacteria group TaxID=1794811 RepID=A0A0G1KC87_9BACT|nr:MAG: hypothetical protein UW78_C0014G0013 [Candidatus Azambacteria bacterium GW2011_GWA1_44_9]OHA90513.1 MAG: hypothetical protein A2838_00870 [Candidatus Zambryskibacteria bacterium RIFCSPHIGHO2_01_FULL_46_25]
MEDIISVLAEQYHKQISIPLDKPKHQFILCPVGLVGAGKTTVVKPLSEQLSLIRISGDDIRKLLKNAGHNYDKVQDISTIVTTKYLDQGYSICNDNDCVTEKTQKIMVDHAKKYGLKIVWIHINPPEEFILNKLSNLKPNWLGTAEQMIENYYQRKPLHENLNFPFVYTFDTSKADLSRQIDEATKIIKRFTDNN